MRPEARRPNNWTMVSAILSSESIGGLFATDRHSARTKTGSNNGIQSLPLECVGQCQVKPTSRPRIPGRWKCTNIFQKGGFAAELGTSYSSQRGDSPALFLLEYKAFLPAEFVRVSPNCLDHVPLTRSRADYAPAVRLRGFAWERGNCFASRYA